MCVSLGQFADENSALWFVSSFLFALAILHDVAGVVHGDLLDSMVNHLKFGTKSVCHLVSIVTNQYCQEQIWMFQTGIDFVSFIFLIRVSKLNICE